MNFDKLTHEWRFKEQDGEWTRWFACTAAEAGMKFGRWDTEIRERSTQPTPPTGE